MSIPAKGLIYALSIAMLLVLSVGSSGAQTPRLPDGLSITDEFRPGLGVAIGKVELVQGRVVIMHADKDQGYWAHQGLPLFKGDVIVTQEGGRIRLQLADESVLTVGSRSRMVLAASVYDRKKKSRVSFLRLSIGKVRCLVKKFANFRRSEFKVMTITAVVGVRGSDFVVEADLNRTVVTAFADTRLEVVSLAYPEVAPVLVADFQETIVAANQLPTDPRDVPLEEIEGLKREFIVTPETVEPEVTSALQEKQTATQEPVGEAQVSVADNVLETVIAANQLPTDPRDVPLVEIEDLEPEFIKTQETVKDEVTLTKGPAVKQVLVAADVLVKPVGVEFFVAEEMIIPEVLEEIQLTEQLDVIKEQQVTIIEDVNEQVNQELPGFPATP